nr:hypothetical protein OG513_39595 [Streptomyces sp. NBC_00998]
MTPRVSDGHDDGEDRELSEFEWILLIGVAELLGWEYPPAGHGYPCF